MSKTLLAALTATAMALPALADYSNTVASLKPLAYWRLNETVVPPADRATNSGTLGALGNGYYNGTVVHPSGGALANGTGAGASFDRTGAKVSVPYVPALSTPAPFTIEAWVNPGDAPPPDGQSGLAAVLSCAHMAGNRSGWLIYQSASGWNLRLYNENAGNTSGNVTGGPAPVAGTWYHLAAVYDGTNATVYVNGVGTSGPVTAYVPNKDGALTVGTRSDSAFHYNGSVDEVAYYTNALSAAEIQSHYANGSNPASSATSYAALVKAKNPIVYLTLDEPAYTAPDVSTLPIAKNSGSLGTEADGIFNPGTIPGVEGVTYSGMGAGNKATLFGPTFGGYIDAGASEALNFMAPFSMVAWFKTAPADSRFMSFIGKGDASWRAGMDGDGRNRFAFGGNGDATGTRNLNDGQWHQLAGVYDGTNLTMYIDGIVDAVQAAPTLPQGSFDSLTLGTVPDYLADRVFNGSLDEIAVFGTNLTAQQVATLFSSANVPPAFAQQPTAAEGYDEGSPLTLVAKVTGSSTLAYQWFKDSAALAGKTNATLAFPSLLLADSGAYQLVVTNGFGSVTSSVVNVNVQAGPPIVYVDPSPVVRYSGEAASFAVTAGGSLPLTYQWLKDGAVLPGQTARILTVDPLTAATAGGYACRVSNPYGAVTSVVAVASVVAAPTASYPVAVLADGPMAFWRLGESTGGVAKDYVGGFDGFYSNVVQGVSGYAVADADLAAKFGPAAGSRVAGSSGINFATNGGLPSFTIEAWVKGGAQSSDAGIVTLGTGAGGEQFNLDTGGGNRALRFFVRDAGGGAQLATSSFVLDGDWHHVVATLDGSTGAITLFVDGNQQAVATISTTAGLLASTQTLTIGSRQSGTTAYDNQFDGSIDEVAIYGYALDATQIYTHYAARYAPASLPVIGVQPVSTTNYVSLTTLLSVSAEGPDGLSYEWRRNGVAVDGGAERTLTLTALEAAMGGDYSVVVSNPYGSVTSSVAKLTVLPAPTSLDVSESLVLHLPFDGSLADTSGRGNNGTNVGATTLTEGVIGSGSLRYFTDTGSSSFNYVTLGERSDLKFSSNVNFSVAYWIKTPAGAITGDLPVLCSARGSAFSPGYTFAPSYNEGGWSWSLNGTGVYGAQSSINDGNWHHVAHTFDRSGNAVTYLDGVQVDVRSVAAVGDIDQAAATNIGQDPNGTYGESGEAEVDDIGVWRRVLTPLEIGGIYVAGVSNGVSFASAPTGPITMSIGQAGSQVQVIWTGGGTLQAAPSVTGTFTNVPGAASPYSVAPAAPQSFFRVTKP